MHRYRFPHTTGNFLHRKILFIPEVEVTNNTHTGCARGPYAEHIFYFPIQLKPVTAHKTIGMFTAFAVKLPQKVL